MSGPLVYSGNDYGEVCVMLHTRYRTKGGRVKNGGRRFSFPPSYVYLFMLLWMLLLFK